MKLYGLKKCTTCQKATDWLGEKSAKFTFTDVKETQISESQIAKWSKALGGWEKMINRAGYTWRGLPAAETTDLTEAKAVKLAAAHPSLIRRPLIEHDDGTVTVGFSEKIRNQLAG